MQEYEIIVIAEDRESARSQFLAWLDEHEEIRRLLANSGPDGSDDVIVDHIVGEGRKLKYQYRIRRSIIENGKAKGSQTE
jgi:hypothetical protein